MSVSSDEFDFGIYDGRSPSVWQRSGETMSLKSACAQYGVTEEQCRKANIRCQWRSMYGNSYAVVVISDIQDLKAVLTARAEKAKHEKLKEKLGPEGYKAYLQKQAAKKVRDKQKPRVEEIMKNMLTVNAKDSNVPVKGVKIAHSNAKKIWMVDGGDDIRTETKGRMTLYDLEDVIQASLNAREKGEYTSSPARRLKKILERLDKYGGDNERNQLASFYRQQLQSYLPEVVEKVAKEMIQTVRADIRMAEREIDNKKTNLTALQVISGKSDPSPEEMDKENQDPTDESKKRKSSASPPGNGKKSKSAVGSRTRRKAAKSEREDADFTPTRGSSENGSDKTTIKKVTPTTVRKTRSSTRALAAKKK